MGQQYKSLTAADMAFIQEQKLFFIASASNHEVNLSPRGYDSIYIHDEKTLYIIDYLGSGNRTARDINEDGEVTLMFTAFEGAPRILRCFCKGEVILKDTSEFNKIGSHFDADLSAIRHIFCLRMYAVESSCGMGVPVMHYEQDREGVKEYALKLVNKGGFDDYVQAHITPPDLSKV